MRRLFKILLAVLIGLSMMAADNPKCDTGGRGRVPACENGCHDPIPVNPPHSKQPRDKQVRVLYEGVMGLPHRTTHVTAYVGGKKVFDDDEYQRDTFRFVSTGSPGQLVALTISNTEVEGELIGGFTHCQISVGRKNPLRVVGQRTIDGKAACHVEGYLRDGDA